MNYTKSEWFNEIKIINEVLEYDVNLNLIFVNFYASYLNLR